MSTITVNRNELASALTFAQLGLSRRPAVPVLGGMLVTVSNGTLELAAFDYEISARAKVSGHASGPGQVLVNGSDLAAAVKSLPKGKKVTAGITISDDALVIECDGTESTIAGMGDEATKEYPQLPAMQELSGYADAEMFATSVRRAAECAGRDDTLPVLTCVNLTSDHGHLELAATDRYRLGVDRIHWTGPDGINAIVPAVTLAKFAKAADKTGKIALHFGDQRAGFSDGTRSLTVSDLASSHGSAAFPKYRQLIRNAKEHTATVQVKAGALEAAVTRAGKLTDRNAAVRLEFAGFSVTVRAYRDGNVTSTQTVPAILDGDPIEAGYNPGYLAGVLRGFDGEISIGLAGAMKPAQLTAGDYTAVIMPVRIQG